MSINGIAVTIGVISRFARIFWVGIVFVDARENIGWILNHDGFITDVPSVFEQRIEYRFIVFFAAGIIVEFGQVLGGGVPGAFPYIY